MKTIEQTRLELFEKWFKRDVWKDGCFGNPDILKRQLWPCFNAALDTVVIELPQMTGEDNGGCFHDAATHDSAVSDCRTAIESTNLGLKII